MLGEALCNTQPDYLQTMNHTSLFPPPLLPMNHPTDESSLPPRFSNGISPSSASSSTSASRYSTSHPGGRRRRRHLAAADDDDEDEDGHKMPADRNAGLWWCVMLGLALIVFGICSVYGMKIYMEYLERIKVSIWAKNIFCQALGTTSI